MDEIKDCVDGGAGTCRNIALIEGLRAELDAARAEINQLHLAAAADMSRLLEAATKAGILYTGCDTPDTLADAVLAARARIAELEAERRWISVKERLPDDEMSQMYLVICENSAIRQAIFWPEKRKRYWTWKGERFQSDITHWQPLPPPPQE